MNKFKYCDNIPASGALMLLAGHEEAHLACKNPPWQFPEIRRVEVCLRGSPRFLDASS